MPQPLWALSGSKQLSLVETMALAVRGQKARWRTIPALGWLSLVMGCAVLLPVLSVIFELRAPASEIWSHVATALLPQYALNTLILACGTGLLTSAIGIGAAFIMTHSDFPMRRTLQWLLVLPVALPPYVMAYIYYDLLSVAGPVQTTIRDLTGLNAREFALPPIASLPGAILVLSISLYPYVYLAAWAAFAQQGTRLVESARSLGCSKWQAFRRVSLPLARPAIVAGLALVLMETMAEFGALSILGVQTFTTGIYKAWFGMGDRVAAAQLAVILLAIVSLLLWLERSQRRGRIHDSRQRGEVYDRPLSGRLTVMAGGLCLIPWLAGFVLPIVYLGWLVAGQGFYLSAQTSAALANTLEIAAVTTVIALTASLLMIYGTRLATNRLVNLANRFAALGYAVPGPVLAIGALVPLSAIDRALGGIMSHWFDARPQLWFSGTTFVLVYVYLVRFMTITLGGIEAGFLKIKPSIEEAAAVLGYGALRRLVFVHAKLIAPALAASGMLIFVDVAKELPATLILRPFNFDTLAVEVFTLASDERLSQAASPALILVTIGLVPAWLLSRTMRR